MDWRFIPHSTYITPRLGLAFAIMLLVTSSVRYNAKSFTRRNTSILVLSVSSALWAFFNAFTPHHQATHLPTDLLQIFGFRKEVSVQITDAWWSEQLYLFAVGPWSLFLIDEGETRGVRHIWLYMLLAQAVSIPLASNVFLATLMLMPHEIRGRKPRVSPSVLASCVLCIGMLLQGRSPGQLAAPHNIILLRALLILSLLLPAWTYPSFSVQLKRSYYIIALLSFIASCHTLFTSDVALKLTDTPASPRQLALFLYSYFRHSLLIRDVLCVSIPFAAFTTLHSSSGGLRNVLSGVCLLVGIPVLSITSALSLALNAEDSQRAQPGYNTSSADTSPRTLLEKIELFPEDRSTQYAVLWEEDGQVFYATTDVDGREVGKLVGAPVPRSKVYPRWRDSIKQAGSVIQPDTFVKYPYKTIILTISSDFDVPSLVDSEIDTLQLLSQKPHPNIVEYRGCLRMHNMVVGICLRRYSYSLYDLVEDSIPQEKRPPYNPSSIVTDIKCGVEAIHSFGLVHDDLNPGNIMIDECGRAVIIDFDSCRPVGAASRGGTPGWSTKPATALYENDYYAVDLLDKFMRGEYDGQDISAFD